MKRVAVVFVAVVALIGVIVAVSRRNESSPSSGNGASTTQPAPSAALTIAVIPKGTAHSYWKSVEAGSQAAGQELGVTINYKGPVQENERTAQINLVQQFVSQGVDGIVLAPLDANALLDAVQSATAKKIPVVIIDSALSGEAGKDFVCYVGTDNRKAGQIAGTELAKELSGKGKVILLRYQPGSASTTDREEGFLDIMKQNPGITVISSDQYAGATISEAQTASLNLLSKIRDADGIFCPNESTTLGMAHAMDQSQLLGKIHFVGFDATPPELDLLKASQVNALVSQNPVKMGHDGVVACVNTIRGSTVDKVNDSGVELITNDNLNSPDIQKFLSGK